MYRKKFFIVILSIVLGFTVMESAAWAGAPTDKIRETTDKILAIVSNTALKGPEKEQERRKLIHAALNERFDWKEMARRSLALHWSRRTDEEKKDFIDLYKKLLERTYLGKVENYSGEKVIYVGETIDGEYGSVRVKIITTKDQEILVEYRLRNGQTDWKVYDISIAGVSLINNYRAQFNSIITKSSYQELVKRLTEKVSQE